MNKVVINNCEGIFALSVKAIAHIIHQNKPDTKLYFYKRGAYNQKGLIYVKTTIDNADLVSLKDFGDSFNYIDLNVIESQDNIVYFWEVFTSRHDPRLIKAVKELGKEANGKCANLQIVEVDSDRYIIENNDGYETVLTPETINWIKFI